MDSAYSSAPVAPPKESSKPESVDEETAEEQTTVIPNKILSPDGEPLKEGDEVVLVVVKNYGEESEVKYAPKKGGESETGMMEEPMAQAGKELAALDTEGQ